MGRDQESRRAISGRKKKKKESLLFMVEAGCEARQVTGEGGWAAPVLDVEACVPPTATQRPAARMLPGVCVVRGSVGGQGSP